MIAIEELTATAAKIRLETFRAIARAGGGHFGGSLSVVEILTVLYFSTMKIDPRDPHGDERDRFILSKGHAGPALYVTLAERGFFPREWLGELDQDGSRLPKHIDRSRLPGIDVSSGALGQGLSIGVGIALGARLDARDTRVYVVLGDGECNEGQIWEAAMTAAKYGLHNLTTVIDRNKAQVDGLSAEVMPTDPLADKWRVFGWEVLNVNGHNVQQLQTTLDRAKKTRGKPTLIIAETIKGRGVSFMEGRYEWHSGMVKEEQYSTAISDLERLLTNG